MDKLKLKKEILEAGKAKIEGIVNDFQETSKRIKSDFFWQRHAGNGKSK